MQKNECDCRYCSDARKILVKNGVILDRANSFISENTKTIFFSTPEKHEKKAIHLLKYVSEKTEECVKRLNEDDLNFGGM